MNNALRDIFESAILDMYGDLLYRKYENYLKDPNFGEHFFQCSCGGKWGDYLFTGIGNTKNAALLDLVLKVAERRVEIKDLCDCYNLT